MNRQTHSPFRPTVVDLVRTAFVVTVAVAVSAVLAGPATACGGATAKKSAAKQDIVDIAASAGSFDTLIAAVKAADLVDVLKGDGPFTVFAPSDEAFAKIPKDELAKLLKDKDALRAVLKFHVVPGKMKAADVVKARSLETVQGQKIAVDTSDGVRVADAAVIQTDIGASNGVIHVIDTVMMPN